MQYWLRTFIGRVRDPTTYTATGFFTHKVYVSGMQVDLGGCHVEIISYSKGIHCPTGHYGVLDFAWWNIAAKQGGLVDLFLELKLPDSSVQFFAVVKQCVQVVGGFAVGETVFVSVDAIRSASPYLNEDGLIQPLLRPL